MSRQCGQCRRPDCPVSSSDSQVAELHAWSVLLDQPFTSSEMGDSMDADLLPELSGETWVASALLEGLVADLPTAGSDIDLIVDASGCDSHYCSGVGTVGSGSGLVGLSRTFPGVTMLAITDWQYVGGYGWEIMVSSGSSVGSLSACCTRPGASGDDSQIS